MSERYHFIIIDDDRYNNIICNAVLKKRPFAATISLFESADEGMSYIQQNYSEKQDELKTVLLLDINMPLKNGWEFMNDFEMLDATIREQFRVFMLSSSIDENDFSRASQNPNVQNYIVKPLTVEKISNLFSDLL